MPLRAEFIGKEVQVKGSEIKGTIIDETKNGFTIQTRTQKKTILKSNRIFEIKIGGEILAIEGNRIQQRPEDRIKLKQWK